MKIVSALLSLPLVVAATNSFACQCIQVDGEWTPTGECSTEAAADCVGSPAPGGEGGHGHGGRFDWPTIPKDQGGDEEDAFTFIGRILTTPQAKHQSLK